MISDKEYDKLIKRLEFFDTTRNNLRDGIAALHLHTCR